MKSAYFVSAQQAAAQLALQKEQHFVEVLRHGSVRVEYFAPKKIDTQLPHEHDELYVIKSGEGFFMRNGERIHFNSGDVLFVPAGMEHYFVDFSDDFATWVIFYGPNGGESTI